MKKSSTAVKSLALATAALVSVFSASAKNPLQSADCGSVVRNTLYSPQLADSVDIDVWLPEGYTAEQHYPVLYMHDGQNLFDASTTWNGQSWEMDATCCELIQKGQIKPIIIVGIHSDPEIRVSELMPLKAVADAGLEDLMKEVKLGGKPVLGDKYVEFVTETLKPWVDSTFSTLTDKDNTAVMGSSMGGLMSLYLICERPDVFGSAACMSTHWYGTLDAGDRFGNAMIRYVADCLPDPSTHRIYFDHGTETIDAYYAPWELKALDAARAKGYVDGVNLDNMVDEGAAHTETAWAARVDRPLRFLFPSQNK